MSTVSDTGVDEMNCKTCNHAGNCLDHYRDRTMTQLNETWKLVRSRQVIRFRINADWIKVLKPNVVV